MDEGVSFLNQFDPNWRNRIEINDLDIRSECNCVVGQIVWANEEEWKQDPNSLRASALEDAATHWLGDDSEYASKLYAIEFGFDTDPYLQTDDNGISDTDQYRTLQQLWLEELSK